MGRVCVSKATLLPAAAQLIMQVGAALEGVSLKINGLVVGQIHFEHPGDRHKLRESSITSQ